MYEWPPAPAVQTEDTGPIPLRATIAKPDVPWSIMRVVMLVTAVLGTGTLVAMGMSSIGYTGRLATNPGFWLIALVAVVFWVGVIGAYVRDQIVAALRKVQCRQKQLLEGQIALGHEVRDLRAGLEGLTGELARAVVEYGDSRASDAAVATMQRSNVASGRGQLYPVEN